ncbi:MAG: DUF3300 domain-containing protein [Halioglobus sp.]
MRKQIMTGVASVIAVVFIALVGACGEDAAPPASAQPPPATVAAEQSAIDSNAVANSDQQAAVAPASTYSAESLESLLAPVALYPDPVLAQVLATSTNPQEVLDAGNWLIENPGLNGPGLESAAIDMGFTPPMVALVQFPTVVDMMCMEMDWTTELGSAFIEDESGVLEAVQRLRKQAADMGNLQSSDQLRVATESVNNQEVIVVQPAKPEVVYVPQYDPAVVYTTPAPATTTQVTTATSEGYSGGELITTGLLAFGAGILVNEVFDDDDDDYYYPRWGYGYGGPPYYPPPYRPRYGNGYRPAHSYHRPPNYQHGFNNNNIYVNTDGKNYFNRFDSGKNNYRKNPNSPITVARKERSDLTALNNRQPTLSKPVQGSYAGKKPELREAGGLAKRPNATVKAPTGSYAGAKLANKDRPQVGGTRDRGFGNAQGTTRPTGGGKLAGAANKPQLKKPAVKRPGGFQGSHDSGRFERAASKRGRDSMANRPRPSKAQSGGKLRKMR